MEKEAERATERAEQSQAGLGVVKSLGVNREKA